MKGRAAKGLAARAGRGHKGGMERSICICGICITG